MNMTPDERKQLEARLDQRADRLIAEFRDHMTEVNDRRREAGKQEIDRSTAFEGWAIQKIAGLQIHAERVAQTFDQGSI